MKVLVFGNPFVKEDFLALKIIPLLKKEFPKIDFKEFDSAEDLQKEGRNLIILDAVENLREVKLFEFNSLEDFDKIQANKVYSMHDFDLGYNLKLLKKINLLDKVRVIGVPFEIEEKEAFNQIQLILRKCVAQDMQGS